MDNITSRNICPVCRSANGVSVSGAGANTSEIHCPRCGRYQVQALAATQLQNSPPAFPPAHLLSGLCRNTWDMLGEKVLVTVDLFKSWAELDKAAKIAVPRELDLAGKADYLLRFVRRSTRTLVDTVAFTPGELAVGFCASRNELAYCLKYLVGRGWVEEAPPPRNAPQQGRGAAYPAVTITPAGWARLDMDTSSAGGPPAAAVSLSLDGADDVWTKGLSAGVAAVGYKAVRVDSKEHGHKICDAVAVAVRGARFVVADLTGQSPLAYFEAGLAQGLGKPVFWTCEEGEARDKRLSLETRQQIVTTWTRDKLDDFARRLALRVEALLGRPVA
jgi:hypothetical protein